MKLCDIKKTGKYKILGVEDNALYCKLRPYGFLIGSEIYVMMITKRMYIIKLFGSVYSINESFAKLIEVSEDL